MSTAERDDLDPLCKLISKSILENQHYRLCVALFRSSYFKDKFAYPILENRYREIRCYETVISFKTEEAIRQAADNIYSERMTKCRTVSLDTNAEVSLYVSRAYITHQVFLYRRDPSDQKIYLENLTVDLNLITDYNFFDDVED